MNILIDVNNTVYVQARRNEMTGGGTTQIQGTKKPNNQKKEGS